MYIYREDMIDKNENIGMLKSVDRAGSEKHIHEFVELVYTLSGQAVHHINDSEYSVKKGDMLFINYKEEHSFTITAPYTYINILIKPVFFGKELINSENIYDIFSTFLWDGFNRAFDKNKCLISFQSSEDFLETEMIIEKMHEEFLAKRAGYKSILNGYLRVIFAKIIRKMQGREVSPYMSKITPEIMEYINENCFGKISLTEIARKSFYNSTYFSRIFKEYCGQSLSSYIKKKRIEEALGLLKSTDMTVDKIYGIVGYSEKKQFYKHFKEYVGVTPSAYRKLKL